MKKKIIMIAMLVVLILAVVGISYAAFTYTGIGGYENQITTGEISMSYEESSNIINIEKALPTTDTTGYQRLNEGEYFDFTVTTNIKGNTYINYEISAKAIDGNTIDGENIKLYLSKINADGKETAVTPISFWIGSNGSSGIRGVPTYSEEEEANSATGRPAGEMSLTTGTVYTQGKVTTKYRLRMWVSEDYNPQGDGGNLTFGVKVNVYGKNEVTSDSILKERQNNQDIWTSGIYNNVTSIVTKGDTEIPESAIQSWNMSASGDDSIIAYIEDDGSGAGTYKLTIGGKGKINANPNMSEYFYLFSKLTSIDLSYLDTSKVTNMSNIFQYCSSLTSIDLSIIDTSNVIDMSSMFRDCSSLTNIIFGDIDTSNVENMYQMFFNCNSLTNINFGNIDTSNVTNMGSMFSGCSSLTSIDLSSLDTSSVTDMSLMFSNCSSLTTIDFGDINTSNVTNMSSMFSECSSLTSIDLSTLDTSSVTSISWMFRDCSSLTNVNFGNIDTSNVTNMDGMFRNCSSLKTLDLSNFDTSNVTIMGNEIAAMFGRAREGMFGGCTSLTELDLRSFDTHNVTNMWGMFYNTPNLTKILVDESKWSTSQANTGYMFDNSGVSAVTFG